MLVWLVSIRTWTPVSLAFFTIGTFVLGGISVGATGIGGVVLVPLLLLAGVDVSVAAPAVLASFLISGLVAVALNLRRGTVPHKQATWICAGLLPGTAVGSLLLPRLPPLLIALSLATMACVSGLKALAGGLFYERHRAQIVVDGIRAVRCIRSHGDEEQEHQLGLEMSTTPTARGAERMMESDDVCMLPMQQGKTMVWHSPHRHTASLSSVDSTTAFPRSCVSDTPFTLASLFLLACFTLASLSHTQTQEHFFILMGCLIGCLSVLTASGGPLVCIPLLISLQKTMPPNTVVAIAQCCAVPISVPHPSRIPMPPHTPPPAARAYCPRTITHTLLTYRIADNRTRGYLAYRCAPFWFLA